MPETRPTIYQIFQEFKRNGLEINQALGFIKIQDTENFLLKKEWDFQKIKFFDFNEKTQTIEEKTKYIELFIHQDLEPAEFINHWANENNNSYGYNLLKDYSIFRKIFNDINIVRISDTYSKDLKIQTNIMFLKVNKFKEILKIIKDISQKVSASKRSLENFLVNRARFDFLGRKTKRTTTITKGDFEFLIHRLNLTTKQTKEEFHKYLNGSDISSLGELFDIMIRKEVFDDDYLRKLDDYFIKEKLEDIIAIGGQILNLKVESVETKEAKKLINKIFWEEIWQLESVWQKYFEKYLLYLFFSYKKIVPKVEFKKLDNLEKKYPDFIGVNHYDWIDVIEIKTHLKNILVWDSSHKNFAFSPEMSKAIIQTINYMDVVTDKDFKKTKDRKDLLEYLNIKENLSRPRGIIIISSKSKICKNTLTEEQKNQLNKDFTKLRNSIHNIQIFTFDEILDIAKRYVENIKPI